MALTINYPAIIKAREKIEARKAALESRKAAVEQETKAISEEFDQVFYDEQAVARVEQLLMGQEDTSTSLAIPSIIPAFVTNAAIAPDPQNMATNFSAIIRGIVKKLSGEFTSHTILAKLGRENAEIVSLPKVRVSGILAEMEKSGEIYKVKKGGGPHPHVYMHSQEYADTKL